MRRFVDAGAFVFEAWNPFALLLFRRQCKPQTQGGVSAAKISIFNKGVLLWGTNTSYHVNLAAARSCRVRLRRGWIRSKPIGNPFICIAAHVVEIEFVGLLRVLGLRCRRRRCGRRCCFAWACRDRRMLPRSVGGLRRSALAGRVVRLYCNSLCSIGLVQ